MLNTTVPPNKAVLEYGSHAVVLPEGDVVVGRGPECTHRIFDPNISREHLRIHVAAIVTIEDLDSTNGTFLNGMPVRGVKVIHDGDEIAIGGRTLRLRVGDPQNFDCDEATPVVMVSRQTHDTLTGVGAVTAASIEQTCPTCGPVAFDADTCTVCGVRWPRQRRPSKTYPLNEAVSAARLAERAPPDPGQAEHHVSVHYVSPLMELNGTASELSEREVFISTLRVDPVGTSCRLVFIYPDGEQVTRRGFVRRVLHRGPAGKAGMGIEFGRK